MDMHSFPLVWQGQLLFMLQVEAAIKTRMTRFFKAGLRERRCSDVSDLTPDERQGTSFKT